MRRGEIWIVAGGPDYAGKPRPAVIVQDDAFVRSTSVTICSFTTRQTETPIFRPVVEPNPRNGLNETCRLMVDKITTVPKGKLGRRIGRLDEMDLLNLNRTMIVFLGLAASPKTAQRSTSS